MLSSGSNAIPKLRLGWRNAARNPRRSLLTATMISSAAFLIVTVAAGRRNPIQETPLRASGNGGFLLVAESSNPILYDLNTSAGREKLNLATPAATATLQGVTVAPLRVQPGEDASCLNLFQTRRPTILGIPDDLLAEWNAVGRFKFSGLRTKNPWDLLKQPPDSTTAIPIFGDMNTLMYSLHKGPGDLIDLEVRDQTVPLRVAGMLDGSVFQGVLLMAESHFLKLFPERQGFQYFLLDLPSEASVRSVRATEVTELLESALADYGFDAEPVAARLAAFLAVQNTYLSTFAALGGLGLLLGTVGLAAMMMRNVAERRRELGLLQAIGFSQRQTLQLILSESGGLLVAALGLGTVAALIAMFPHLRQTGADLPLWTIPALLTAVTLTGLTATALAVRRSLRPTVLELLRSE